MTSPTPDTGRIDVRYVAHLARLGLTDEEATTFQGQLVQIVDYIQTISTLDLSEVEPMARPQQLQNIFRDDVALPSLPRDAVLRNAPASRDGLFSVPKIVE